ncbi:3730_t:CDS:2 [Ambispora gerdemannii]|uniref:3730_t:CDS:1 n=1 Tax=Ambispora gerdemannii TaxID=144530 RepID=A0A9N8YZK0_9GLOM|nr:3730_t:CDS:2 [Ambispora gerdemannii]
MGGKQSKSKLSSSLSPLSSSAGCCGFLCNKKRKNPNSKKSKHDVEDISNEIGRNSLSSSRHSMPNYSWMDGRRFLEDSNYLLPKDDEEIDRSNTIHFLVKHVLNGNYKAPITDTMKKCLDVGSGNGAWLMDMASEFPDVSFIGVDIDLQSPSAIYPQNCQFDTCDILGGLPYEDETFDYVHCRWVICWLPREKFRFVLEEMIRVTKRGGWIEFLESNFAEVRNPGPVFKSLWNTWKEISELRRYDNHVIMTLEKILRELPVDKLSSTKISVPFGEKGEKTGEIWKGILSGAYTAMSPKWREYLNISAEQMHELIDAVLKEHDERGVHTNWYLFVGQRKFRSNDDAIANEDDTASEFEIV